VTQKITLTHYEQQRVKSYMAEVVYSLVHCNREIRLQLECVTSNLKNKLIHSEKKKDRVSPSDSENSALEIKLDIENFMSSMLYARAYQSGTIYHT
jgi:hypothetical protein